MQFNLNEYELGELLAAAAEMGSRVTLSRMGKLPPYLSRSDAYRRYGRQRVDRWLEKDWITPRKDGGHSANWRIDRMEADALLAAQRIITLVWTNNQQSKM
jgi:hypothetical protein